MTDDRFNPIRQVENSQLILVDGQWPNFHDAEIHRLYLWRGDVRPDDSVWIGARLTVELLLCALRDPFVATLEFADIEALRLEGFSTGSAIDDLSFQVESRGVLRNGEPLSPWICVEFEPFEPLHLSFKCMRVKVVGRVDQSRTSLA